MMGFNDATRKMPARQNYSVKQNHYVMTKESFKKNGVITTTNNKLSIANEQQKRYSNNLK